MKQALRKLSLCAVALPFLVLANPAQAAMTGAQIKAARSGKSFTLTGPTSGSVEFYSNGSYRVKNRRGTHNGSWWISGNRYCSKRSRKGKMTTKCHSMTDIGGGKYWNNDGYTYTPK